MRSTQEGRSELKYALPAARRGEVLALAGGHVQVGAHTHSLAETPGVTWDPADPPPFGYRVHSLYLDTPRLDGYGSRLDGEVIRDRLRIRTYGLPGESAAVYLEAKRKLHRLVVKHRVRAGGMRAWQERAPALPWDGAVAALEGEARRVGERWLAAVAAGGMVPVCITHYVREVWEDGSTRLTLDHAVRASGGEDPWRLQRQGEVPLLPEDWIVLELKYNGAAPGWIRTLVREMRLQAEPVSKFALAVARTARRDAPAELVRLTPPSVLRAGRGFARPERLAGAAR